jgi:hypothetical protein
MWKISADDILRMVEGDHTAGAVDIRRRATELVRKISTWGPKTPPSDDERKDVISSIMTLYREAHEHVVSRRKP